MLKKFVYFNVDLNNIRARRNNVGHCRNNVVNMNAHKKDKKETSSQKLKNIFELQSF